MDIQSAMVLERVKGIEPSYSAWKAAALPLSYTRITPGNAPEYRLPAVARWLWLDIFSIQATGLDSENGGRCRTRTYEGVASGFTVRPLCRSGQSPTLLLTVKVRPATASALWPLAFALSTLTPPIFLPTHRHERWPVIWERHD